jgi:hypothetical protein
MKFIGVFHVGIFYYDQRKVSKDMNDIVKSLGFDHVSLKHSNNALVVYSIGVHLLSQKYICP